MIYLDPVMWKYTASYAAHKSRKEHAIDANKLTYKVADVGGHRLYAVIYELEHAKAVFSSWGIPGRGISIRAAEQLLENIDSAVEVPFQSVEFPPEPTWTPEAPAHEALRQRILTFLERGAINPEEAKSQSQDVFLYPSGMAAVFTAKELLQDYRPGGINIELGITFHHTHELFHEGSPGGLKHIPTVDTEALDGLEDWLEKHKSEGGATFVFVEFPGNPTLETVDLPRLKKLVNYHIALRSSLKY
jgi:cystathionine gamma-synthase